MQSSNITLQNCRLPKTGGALNVTVNNLSSTARVTATLGSSGPMILFTMNSDGSYTGMVPGDDLSNIPPGPLSVTITAGDMNLTQTIHVYVPPTFMMPASASLALSGVTPSWAQVGGAGLIFDAEDMTSPSQRAIHSYAVSGSKLTQQPALNFQFGYVPTSVLTDVTSSLAVQLAPQSGQTYSLGYAALSSKQSTYTSLTMLTYSQAMTLAADRTSAFVAVAGQGTSGPLQAYTLPAMANGQTMQASLTGIPTNEQPALLGWGLIDNDALVDLVAIHSDNTAAVYLQQSGQAFAYSQTYAMGLQTGAALTGATQPGFAVGDVDQDGLDDVIIAQGGQVNELTNDSCNGTFTSTPLLSVPADLVAVGDVNGDSIADLVVVQKNPGMILVFLNTST
jgi:hypothetical protein